VFVFVRSSRSRLHEHEHRVASPAMFTGRILFLNIEAEEHR
jgi:hypothetical protein